MIFPWRKAGRPWRVAEVSTHGSRAGMLRSSGARSDSGGQYLFATGLDCRDVPRFHLLRTNRCESHCAAKLN